MKLTINYQESYSRGELLLRTFFGMIYIFFPHVFLMIFFGIWSQIITFIAFWSILFTGRYPQSFFEFNVGMQRWSLRLNARFYNLADGYPSFGVNGTDEHTSLEIPYPESLGRGLLIVKVMFGALYVAIPHVFILYFRFIWGAILGFIAFWSILFTGTYPRSFFDFNVGTLRWITRVNLYLGLMTDKYPPFSGKE